MKILHYALGFAPYRTGGLTKFCMDLMQQQLQQGHDVGLIWPGEMRFLGGKTRIRTGKKVAGVGSYEVINPTPVSYDEGIADTRRFMEEGDLACYRAFFQHRKPQVLHVHTLMGLHMSMLTAAREQGIRLVFTTHDFFPICPKVTLFRGNQVCPTAKDCQYCTSCNTTALPTWKVQLLQSPFYRCVKNSALVKKLRKGHRDAFLMDTGIDRQLEQAPGTHYLQLRRYYEKMLTMMDAIHYNSTVSRKVYQAYMDIADGVVIPISHKDIADRREKKEFRSDLLKVTYLGPPGGAKGYFVLKAAMDRLWKQTDKVQLNVFFEPKDTPPYMRTHGRYAYEDLQRIFSQTDVLVAPSVWYETFGYTVLEALSFGVPVVISSNVGAQDILPEGAGVIVENISEENLARCLQQLTAQTLQEMNRVILEKAQIQSMEQVSEQIITKCYCVQMAE